jgi:hypothetical protein
MIERRGCAGLLLEAVQTLLVVRDIGRQNLQGHSSPQLSIQSEVNFTHPARAEL